MKEAYYILAIITIVFLAPAILAYGLPVPLHMLKFLGCSCDVPSPSEYFEVNLWVLISGTAITPLVAYFISLHKVRTERGFYYITGLTLLVNMVFMLYIVFHVITTANITGIDKSITTIALSLLSVTLEVAVISRIFFFTLSESQPCNK